MPAEPLEPLEPAEPLEALELLEELLEPPELVEPLEELLALELVELEPVEPLDVVVDPLELVALELLALEPVALDAALEPTVVPEPLVELERDVPSMLATLQPASIDAAMASNRIGLAIIAGSRMRWAWPWSHAGESLPPNAGPDEIQRRVPAQAAPPAGAAVGFLANSPRNDSIYV